MNRGMPRVSSERAKIRIAEFNMAGRSSGTVILLSTAAGDAPALNAAFSSVPSDPRSEACTVRKAIGSETAHPRTAMPAMDERFHVGSPRSLPTTWVT
jgi:hypothetical protein